MFTMIIFAAIGFIVGVFEVKRARTNGKNSLLADSVFGPLLCSATGAMVGMLIALSCLRPFLPQYEIVSRNEVLVSMSTVEGTSGTFVLGTGGINSTTIYRFYVLNGDGSASPEHVSSSQNVRIYEDAASNARGKWTTYSLTRDRSSWLAYFALFNGNDVISRHEFHVPEGTVLNDFRVN